MKVISKVEFTPEEKKAISIICNISCDNISCKECPFDISPTLPCVRSIVKVIARNAEIKCDGE